MQSPQGSFGGSFLREEIHAQFDTATVLGTIRDASQSLIAGVSVTLANTATGVSESTLTSDVGDYQFFEVTIGRCAIVAATKDFDCNCQARQRVVPTN